MRLTELAELKPGAVVFVMNKKGALFFPAKFDRRGAEWRMGRAFIGMQMVPTFEISKRFKINLGEKGRTPWPTLDDVFPVTDETVAVYRTQLEAKKAKIDAKLARVVALLPPL